MSTADAKSSWFGPGLDSDADEGRDTDPDSLPAPAVGESPHFFSSHPARRRTDAGGSAFARLYRAFLAARAALGLALLSTQVLAGFLGATASHWTTALSVFYAAQALALWLLPRLQRGATASTLARLSSPQWWGSIGLDLAVFGLLQALDHSGGVNYGALFVLPVLMAGVLTPRLLALATAAMAALVMLSVAGWAALVDVDVSLRMTQAGLVGSGLFVVSLLASELAGRLAREERSARGSMEFARQQAQLNRLVIDEMQEGVLVVDRRGRVRAANPAARGLLSQDSTPVRTAPFQLRGVAAWLPLVQAVELAFAAEHWPEDGQELRLNFAVGQQRSLRVRMRFTRRREPDTSEDLCVLFIEDNRNLLARSRQEKLAAMGRMSAGIAHEIRNPLAAIAQANALLSEDSVDPRAQQLTRMVASNVQRLKRLVDDVMEVAPGGAPDVVALDASALVNEICLDWARTNALAAGASDPLLCRVPVEPLVVDFEPEHLRRVLVNLLDNALRHADAGPACVEVEVELTALDDQAAWARVTVVSLGPAIAPEVERHLFEPFFSTRSRGSGLGLYICRELCERYGARIDYRRRPAGLRPAGNEFTLLLRRSTATLSPAPISSPSP